jgi:hypothetical protein
MRHDSSADGARVATPLARGAEIYGMSRSTIYREWQKGNLVLIKCGRATLIDDASARAFLAGLPRLKPRQKTVCA